MDWCKGCTYEKRKFCVCGNWKMNVDKCMINVIGRTLSVGPLDRNTEVVIACPAPYMTFARSVLPPDIALAGQNAYKVAKGAFTGEISPAMLKDCYVNWVILGHSERRQNFGETNELIGEKCAHALAEGLNVIACVGDTMKEREFGKSNQVISEQMAALALHIKDWTNLAVAYEPLWAYDSDTTVTTLQAQEVHFYLRSWLAANVSERVSERVRLLYGGALRKDIYVHMAIQADIDGFLVGDESLEPEFLDIINARLSCRERKIN